MNLDTDIDQYVQESELVTAILLVDIPTTFGDSDPEVPVGAPGMTSSNSKKIDWPNGSSYEGELVDGVFSGRGTFLWPSSLNESLAALWSPDNPTQPLEDSVCSLACCWWQGMPHGPAVLSRDSQNKRQAVFDRGMVVLDEARFLFNLADGLFEEFEAEDSECSESDQSSATVKERYGILMLTDGGKYEGFWKHEKPHGQGRLTLNNGDRFEGHWELGLMKGHGVYRFGDGTVFDGEFSDNKRHGFGCLTSANGTTYNGYWINDKPHGHGRIQMPMASYDGQWADGAPHGKGRYCHEESGKYSGEWNYGSRDGLAYALYVDGASYDGHWVEDKPHGRGSYKWPDGSTLEGEWCRGVLSGFGTFRHVDGSQYEGQWIDNEKIGYGMYRFPDGAIYEGRWHKDKPHGKGKFANPHGVLFRGVWESGLFSSGNGILTCQVAETFVDDCKRNPLESVVVARSRSSADIWPPGRCDVDMCMPRVETQQMDKRQQSEVKKGFGGVGHSRHGLKMVEDAEVSPVFCESAEDLRVSRRRGWIPAKPTRLVGYQYKTLFVNELECEGVDFSVIRDEVSNTECLIESTGVGEALSVVATIGIGSLDVDLIAPSPSIIKPMESKDIVIPLVVPSIKGDRQSIVTPLPEDKIDDHSELRYPKTKFASSRPEDNQTLDDRHLTASITPNRTSIREVVQRVEPPGAGVSMSPLIGQPSWQRIGNGLGVIQRSTVQPNSKLPPELESIIEQTRQQTPSNSHHRYVTPMAGEASRGYSPDSITTTTIHDHIIRPSTNNRSSMSSTITPDSRTVTIIEQTRQQTPSNSHHRYVTPMVGEPSRGYSRDSITTTIHDHIIRPSTNNRSSVSSTITPDIRTVTMESVVEVPHVVEQLIIREKKIPQYVERRFPEYVDVHVPMEIERIVPIPVEHNVVTEFQIPKIRPVYRRVDMPIYAPRFIDVPIPVDALDHDVIEHITSLANALDELASNASPSMAAFEKMAQAMNSSAMEVQSCLKQVPADHLTTLVDSGLVKVDESSLQRVQSFRLIAPRSCNSFGHADKVYKSGSHPCDRTETTRSGVDSRSVNNEGTPCTWNYSDSVSSTPRWWINGSDTSRSPHGTPKRAERVVVIPSTAHRTTSPTTLFL